MLKNVMILWFLCKIMAFPIALSNNSVELCARLNLINSFQAQFVQKTMDGMGVIVQENRGELWIQHPNSFNCHIIFPEESYLISDGKVLWFYDVFLNQVMIRWLKDVADDTLLTILISGEKALDWNKYYINKNGDVFSLIPVSNDKNTVLKKIEIEITGDGKIKKFSFLNRDSQRVNYQLMNHNLSKFSVDKFYFSPPYEVDIDDQR